MSENGKLLNSAPIPNWAKLLVIGIALGIQAAVVWFGQKDAVEKLSSGQQMIVVELRHVAERDSMRAVNLEYKVDLNRRDIDDLLLKTHQEVKKVLEKVEGTGGE